MSSRDSEDTGWRDYLNKNEKSMLRIYLYRQSFTQGMVDPRWSRNWFGGISPQVKGQSCLEVSVAMVATVDISRPNRPVQK